MSESEVFVSPASALSHSLGMIQFRQAPSCSLNFLLSYKSSTSYYLFSLHFDLNASVSLPSQAFAPCPQSGPAIRRPFGRLPAIVPPVKWSLRNGGSCPWW